jgi:hypothetical protein
MPLPGTPYRNPGMLNGLIVGRETRKFVSRTLTIIDATPSSTASISLRLISTLRINNSAQRQINVDKEKKETIEAFRRGAAI